MFLKFTIALLACTWGFSCAQDISGPEANPNAPAAEEVQEETKAETASQTDQEMLLKLLANPEMAALLKSLAKNL